MDERMLAQARRWWRTRKDPLGVLIYEPALDGPRIPITVQEFRKPHVKRARNRLHSTWHDERLRTDEAGDRYCERCGIGVREDGSYFDRGASTYGQPQRPSVVYHRIPDDALRPAGR